MSDYIDDPAQLPCAPTPRGDGEVESVYAEFSGSGPAGPGFFTVTLAELVADGGSHLWPRLVWDGERWAPVDAAWFRERFPVRRSVHEGWGSGSYPGGPDDQRDEAAGQGRPDGLSKPRSSDLVRPASGHRLEA